MMSGCASQRKQDKLPVPIAPVLQGNVTNVNAYMMSYLHVYIENANKIK